MAIARVGTPVSGTSNVATDSSQTISYTPAGAGHFIAVWIIYTVFPGAGQAVTSVTDNGAAGGSTYTAAFNAIGSFGSGHYACAIFFTPNCASGITSITANYPTTLFNSAMIVAEYTGVSLSATPDSVSTESAQNDAGPYATNTAAPTGNDLQLAYYYNYDVSTAFVATSPFSIVISIPDTLGDELGATDQINSNTTTASATKVPGGANHVSSWLACFSPASSSDGQEWLQVRPQEKSRSGRMVAY